MPDQLRPFSAERVIYSLLAAALSFLGGAPASAEPMIWLNLDGRRVEGKAAAWSPDGVVLLGRDGRMWSFHPSQASDFGKVNDQFRSMAQNEMRGRLQREFGNRYDVSGTGHYLVVHPAGGRDLWAERFERLYREFQHYFTARGFHPQAPQFPLVAVVCHDRQDFVRFAAKDGVKIRGGTLGYYSPTTNRVLLYDTTAGQIGGDWTRNAETIIHEATHQTAFNTGIHTRLAKQPTWAAEGLATMFEAPGVWNSSAHPKLVDRINHYRLERFRNFIATRHKPGAVEQLIRSDRIFQDDADAAYALAWALTFYLAEREPRKYMDVLRKLASRDPMSNYPSARRLQDFRRVFGDEVPMLEVRMMRFIETLK